MTLPDPLNQATPLRDSLRRLIADDGLFLRAAQVLELVGLSSVGLGEVLQDFARQNWNQLRDIMGAAQRVVGGVQTQDDLSILEHAPFVLKSIRDVLDRTPAAMQRNKAETIGEKETVSREQVVELAHAFRDSGEVTRLIAIGENNGSLSGIFSGEKKEAVPAADASAGIARAHH